MIITVITMYRADTAETYVTVVNGRLTDKDKASWREAHQCDESAACDEDEEPEEIDNMFFREFNSSEFGKPEAPTSLKNIDGEAD